MTPRNKPGVAFWATVVVVIVLVGYPLSFGPACWLARGGALSPLAVAHAYRPVVVSAGKSPSWVHRAAELYSGFMLRELRAEHVTEDIKAINFPAVPIGVERTP